MCRRGTCSLWVIGCAHSFTGLKAAHKEKASSLSSSPPSLSSSLFPPVPLKEERRGRIASQIEKVKLLHSSLSQRPPPPPVEGLGGGSAHLKRGRRLPIRIQEERARRGGPMVKRILGVWGVENQQAAHEPGACSEWCVGPLGSLSCN